SRSSRTIRTSSPPIPTGCSISSSGPSRRRAARMNRSCEARWRTRPGKRRKAPRRCARATTRQSSIWSWSRGRETISTPWERCPARTASARTSARSSEPKPRARAAPMEDLLGYLHVVVLPQMIDALIIGVALALVALGLTMIFGLLDVINLAHGDLYMLGGYAAFTLLGWGAGYWGALVLVPILVGFVGWGLEELGIRPLLPRADRAIVTLLLTFGVSLILRDIAQVVWGTETHAVAPPF